MLSKTENSDAAGSLHITWVGPFGRAVADYVSLLHPKTCATESVGCDMSAAEPASVCDAEVVVAWRPMRYVCESIAAFSRQRKLPFIPVILDSGVLSLGPIILPGSACWNCWMMRSQQHSPFPTQREVLLRFYDSNPHAGPEGFAEPLAMFAASRIIWAVEQCQTRPAAIGGFVWELDLSSRHVQTGQLVGVDGCTNCGLNRPLESRTYAEVRSALSVLWEEIHAEER